MNRTLQILAWGIAGTVLTCALTGAAIVVASNGIATPVRPFSLTTDRPQSDQDASEPQESGHDRGPGGSEDVGQPGYDHVGFGASGSNSGPGFGSSGSGSDEGSDNSEGHHDGGGGDADD